MLCLQIKQSSMNELGEAVIAELSFSDLEKALEGLEAQKTIHSKLKESNKLDSLAHEKVKLIFKYIVIECFLKYFRYIYLFIHCFMFDHDAEISLLFFFVKFPCSSLYL
jgi:hypothetical protein